MAEKIYPSTGTIVAIGRQAAVGTARTELLNKILLTQANTGVSFNMSDLGYEVGSGSISQQRSIKEGFMPGMQLSGHVRVGSGLLNLLAAAGYMIIAEGTAPGSPVTTTLSTALNSRFASTITVADETGLAVGDWIQIGAPTVPGSPVFGDKCEIHEITAINAGTNTLTLKAKTLYLYASGVAVAKVDKNKPTFHYAYHLQPSDENYGANDLFTVYVSFSNGTNTVSLLMFDGKLASFAPNYQVGNPPQFSAEMKFLDITRNATALGNVDTISDPAPIVVQNTRGNFSLLGNTTDAPQSMSFQLQNEIYDDFVLTQLKKQSATILSHALSATASGKFVKEFLDDIIFGGSSEVEVSDAIPESSFEFTAKSPKLIGSSTTEYYSFSLVAPDCQFAGYDPQIGTNQPITAEMGMVKIVPSETDGSERWYFKIATKCASDVYSAA